MLECEGYKMFFGTAEVNGKTVTGIWLYKPEYDCWYCRGKSYPAWTVKNQAVIQYDAI